MYVCVWGGGCTLPLIFLATYQSYFCLLLASAIFPLNRKKKVKKQVHAIDKPFSAPHSFVSFTLRPTLHSLQFSQVLITRLWFANSARGCQLVQSMILVQGMILVQCMILVQQYSSPITPPPPLPFSPSLWAVFT